MQGIAIEFDEKYSCLDMSIKSSLMENSLDANTLHKIINKNPFKHFFIFDQNILEALSNYKTVSKSNSSTTILKRISEPRHTEFKCRIVEGALSAIMSITCKYASKTPSVMTLKNIPKESGIVQGFGYERLSILLEKIRSAAPSEIFKELVARSLPPRNGCSSKLKPRVYNTFSSKGVKVGSSNVKYYGAGLINGDVTEKMSIKATGEITINGIVGPATIKARVNINITQGAIGKVKGNDSNILYGSTLVAKGSIHMQH
jgi:uncharacterized protein (DUF342 family)